MAEVINLRLARKRKRRAEAEAQAAENRARHGRTLEQKRLDAALTEAQRQRLDALRRDTPEQDE